MNQPPIETGYLVLADLSGFTPFVAGSEVDHAQSILANLIGLLRRRLEPALQLAEIEGDALFLFARADRFERGETLLELIESAYVAFRDQTLTMQRNATCPCEACRMIPSLDLKFITHYGEFVLQNLTGSVKPFGSCVNLAHRLLKNDVSEETGWQAYALFTGPALASIGIRPEGMHSKRQSYPHLGECEVCAMDLRSRYVEITSQRRVVLDEAGAHFTVRRDYPIGPARLWELLTDARIRNGWEIGADWSARWRPDGRTGAGATNHCANSNFLEDVLDWRPFDYYTVELRYGPARFRVTGELSRAAESTRLRWSMALDGPLPRPLRARICRFFASRMMRVPERFQNLDRLIAEDARVPA